MKQHSTRFLSLVAQTKPRIKEISAAELKKKLDMHHPFHLIDVREESEWANGHITQAIHKSKGVLERDIEKDVADAAATLVVYCSGGFRSALAADSLQKMGYTNVYSLAGGSTGWQDAGYSLEK